MVKVLDVPIEELCDDKAVSLLEIINNTFFKHFGEDTSANLRGKHITLKMTKYKMIFIIKYMFDSFV